MTSHAELVNRAAHWLRTAKRCRIVLQEIQGSTLESPDVIGWRFASYTLLVECKASLEDFRRDRRKVFRRVAGLGMGSERIYFVPEALAAKVRGELPEGWGLAFPTTRNVRLLVPPNPCSEHNRVAETELLFDALKRATEGWGRKVFGKAAPPTVDGDPHPSASAIIAKLRRENASLRRQVVPCVQCNRPVEFQRRIYVTPTCYACLPPPPPLGALNLIPPVKTADTERASGAG